MTVGVVSAKPKRSNGGKEPEAPPVILNGTGAKLEKEYSAMLNSLKQEIMKGLPASDPRKQSAMDEAAQALRKAQESVASAEKSLGAVKSGEALVEHAKVKWIGGAEKGIAAAQAALKKARTPAETEAAKKDLEKWQANKEDGLKALKERQAALDKAKKEAPSLNKTLESAKAALATAKAKDDAAAKALEADVESALGNEKLDAKLVRCAVLTAATPAGLAEFAQQGRDKESLVEKLLANDHLMKEMLVAGGASYGKYGRAMEIYSDIQKVSPKAADGVLQRLALATALEHAMPIKQTNEEDKSSNPAEINPVKRYQHYEKAYLAGELDPAFKAFNTWELRNVVNCDAPDDILSWGREMLRTYRPDHIYLPSYGWRYVRAVRTEVPYGSQNVQYDLPSLHNYQNILKDGGVCGRRAFFGRFVLRAFGIPTWGVTQPAHAALSHWTPEGWTVNLGAGFEFSWWDKADVPMSGTQFVMETKARAHAAEYMRVLRAQWISRVLGEPAYNERKGVDGGFWSRIALHQSSQLASKAATLGPLGQELSEANESTEKSVAESEKITPESRKVEVKDGVIVIPSVAFSGSANKVTAMKSFSGGMQIHCLGGFQSNYEFQAPRAGKYRLTAQVATGQEGQKFLISTNQSKEPVETPVPYTIGLWQQTAPLEVMLENGKNTLHFGLKEGSRGVTIKEFKLTPVK